MKLVVNMTEYGPRSKIHIVQNPYYALCTIGIYGWWQFEGSEDKITCKTCLKLWQKKREKGTIS